MNTTDTEFNLEQTTLQLINLLDEGIDDPQILNKVQKSIPQQSNHLTQFIDYLRMLASIPQDPIALKWIEVLQELARLHVENNPANNGLSVEPIE